MNSKAMTHLCDLETAARLLQSGHTVAFPTETVYGLGADATSSAAVAKIFDAKQRPTFDPLIVHIADPRRLSDIVCRIPPQAEALMRSFWPGPLTLVLPKQPRIPDLVTSGLPGVGVRIPAHPVALELLQLVDRPIAAPSANLFGGISPTTAHHVQESLGSRIDGILDGGPCLVGVESTVVSFMENQPILLRPGGCPIEDIEKVIGRLERARSDHSKPDAAQPAPGMLSRHYAPSTKLILEEYGQTIAPIPGLNSGLLTYGNQPFRGQFGRILSLCDSEDLQTCAAGFFAALRSLDSCRLDVIIAHKFPEYGLGIAMNDRLTRAAWQEPSSFF